MRLWPGAMPGGEGNDAMSEQELAANETAAEAGDGAGEPAVTAGDALGSGGEAALRAEREARKTAERELKALRTAQAEREAAESAAAEAEAEKRGEFERLAEKRLSERDAARDEATRLRGEVDQLRAAMTAVLDAEWSALPETVRDAYLGAEDDPLARMAFLPKAKAIAAKLAEQERPAATRGNGQDPKPGGSVRSTIEQEKASLLARGGYGM